MAIGQETWHTEVDDGVAVSRPYVEYVPVRYRARQESGKGPTRHWPAPSTD